MDGFDEFRILMNKIIDGEFRNEPQVCRELLQQARAAVEAKDDVVCQMRGLLFEAKEAFVNGWQPSDQPGEAT